jgi:hypothetical protein
LKIHIIGGMQMGFMSFLGDLLGAAGATVEKAVSEGGIYAPGRMREYGYDNTNDIPSEMGTYRVFEKTDSGNKIHYIGVSKDLRRRVDQHKGRNFRPGEFVAIKVANTGTTWEELIAHERKKIEQHNPGRNQRGGGGGRKPVLDID